MKRYYIIFGLACSFIGFLIILRVIEPGGEDTKEIEITRQEGSDEELVEKLGLRKEFYYGIKVLADKENQSLIQKALDLMKAKTPEFFRLVINNVKAIRQSEDLFVLGPVKSVPGTNTIAFSNFADRYTEYNVADFFVFYSTHIIDQHKGRPYTKAAEIKAREAEIAFFQALERVEGRSFTGIIQFIENEIDMIRKGRLYTELP
ncbi:MAG: hypothetical protein JRF71_06295 [Deltaproteobacteria bacterium]|nr:hypothetical protein [Deltaproteobacteria bacterium]